MHALLHKLRTFHTDSSEYVLIASWVLVAISIPLLLIGWYTLWLLAPLYIVFIGFALYAFKKGLLTVRKKALLITIITIVFLLGIMLLRGFYTGDGPGYWLPFARSMVEHHRSIPFIPTQDAATSREPVLPIFLSIGLFFGNSELFYGWVPILFTIATLLLIFKWLELVNVPQRYRYWAALIFLCTPLVAFWSWNILEEAPVLFFFTSFFFYADKYRKHADNRAFLMLSLALGMALLTRYVSLILLIPYVIAWLQTKNKLHVVTGLIALLPFSVWIIRNCLVYQSPFFPLFASVFGGPYAIYQAHALFLGSFSFTLQQKIVYVLKNLTFELPLVWIGLWALVKEKRFDYVAIILVLLAALFSVFFTQTSATRYFYPFIGVLTVYGVQYVVNEKKRLPFLLFTVMLLLSLFNVSVTLSTSSFIGSIEHGFGWLVPIVTFMRSYALIVAIIVALLLAAAKVSIEKMVVIIFSLLALHLTHLRFIENKSWIATWPFILLLVILIVLTAYKKIATNIARSMPIIVAAMVLVLSWGLSTVYAVQNKNLSFNSVSRIYYAQAILEKEIDKREHGGRDFYLLTENPAYYEWNKGYHIVTFRSFNFNFISKLHMEQVHSAADVRDVLRQANIKYLIYEGDEALPAYEQYDTGYLNASNTLYQIARANSTLFQPVFLFEKKKKNITSVIYQIYQ